MDNEEITFEREVGSVLRIYSLVVTPRPVTPKIDFGLTLVIRIRYPGSHSQCFSDISNRDSIRLQRIELLCPGSESHFAIANIDPISSPSGCLLPRPAVVFTALGPESGSPYPPIRWCQLRDSPRHSFFPWLGGRFGTLSVVAYTFSQPGACSGRPSVLNPGFWSTGWHRTTR